MAARGLRNDQIAAGLSIPRQIVSKWRKRFFDTRMAGLKDEPRTSHKTAAQFTRKKSKHSAG